MKWGAFLFTSCQFFYVAGQTVFSPGDTVSADRAPQAMHNTISPDDIPELPHASSSRMQYLSANKLVQLSQELVYAARTGDSTGALIRELEGLSYDVLVTSLPSDNEKKAFWINLYNGFTQILLRNDPGRYANRRQFFTSRQITVAGKSLSLDAIEHGILRRSKIKWSLGHFSKFFPGKTEKKLRVAKLDYRLHFALNCGAKSCPPIAYYNPANLDQQLELATKAYLQQEAKYDSIKNLLELPAIMGWFRGDFGGKQKMILLLRSKKMIPAGTRPRIKFKAYDWTLFTGNFNT